MWVSVGSTPAHARRQARGLSHGRPRKSPGGVFGFPAAFFFAGLALVFLSLGCGDAPPAAAGLTADSETQPTGAPARFPMTVTDGLERRVTIAHEPRRIISLAPKNTELLFAIGAGPRVVGVTSYCDYPPAAQRCERVGGFMASSISLEKVIALKPDLVLTVGSFHLQTINDLERLGLPVLALAADSLEELGEELELLGRVCGRQQPARRLADRIQRRVSQVRQVAATIAEEDRVRVFYQVWSDPLSAAGPASHIGDMLSICGAINIVDDSVFYLPISEETVLAGNPDVILVPSTDGKTRAARQLAARRDWSEINAVRNGRIHSIDDDLISRFGPRSIDALETMAVLLYPEYFADFAREHSHAAGRKEPRP